MNGESPSARHWHHRASPPPPLGETPNAVVDCGWGRLLFAHTFRSAEELVASMREERPGSRDIALYVRDPHVVLALSPEEFFLDPSHTYRLTLEPTELDDSAIDVHPLSSPAEAEAIERLYVEHHMIPVNREFLWANRTGSAATYFVATERDSGEVLGTALGVDHREAFDDPENGCSLWCLAVSAHAAIPGVGKRLIEGLAGFYAQRGRLHLDLSVLHDNAGAIALYESMGFERIPVFAMKRRTPLNEPLFTSDGVRERVNEYSQIIIDEALRRGIQVRPLHGRDDYFQLALGGRRIDCRETLTSLTNAVAYSRCDDKRITHQVLRDAGLRVPAQILVDDASEAEAFLQRYESVVVKPRRGEQGAGISVGVRSPADLRTAIEVARAECSDVLLEERCPGEDLRILVIDSEVVAAAVREPPEITGTGEHTIRELVAKLERRRNTQAVGRIRIPFDEEMERCLSDAGFGLDDRLPEGERLRVRRTANVHKGGTIRDVTPVLNAGLADAAIRATQAIDIPLAGLDFLVVDPREDDYVIIEVNERPALVNHEPQPTAERFIDFLFPQSRAV